MGAEEDQLVRLQFAAAMRLDGFRAEYDAVYRDYKRRCLEWLLAENAA